VEGISWGLAGVGTSSGKAQVSSLGEQHTEDKQDARHRSQHHGVRHPQINSSDHVAEVWAANAGATPCLTPHCSGARKTKRCRRHHHPTNVRFHGLKPLATRHRPYTGRHGGVDVISLT